MGGGAPGRGSVDPFFLEVIVSPTRASATCLMEAARYPTSPAISLSTCTSRCKTVQIQTEASVCWNRTAVNDVYCTTKGVPASSFWLQTLR